MPNFFASSSASSVSASSSVIPALNAACAARSLCSAVGSSASVICRLPNLQNRKQPLHHQTLRDHRLEFVVNDVGRVDLLVHVARDDVLRKFEHAARFELQQHPGMIARDLDLALALIADLALAAVLVGLLCVGGGRISPPQQIAPLAADRLNIDLPVGIAS